MCFGFILRAFSLSDFTSSPENVSVCDAQTISNSFSLSCGFTGPAFPLWNVSGLSTHQFETLSRGQSVGGYLTYPQPSGSTASLNVDLSSSMEVVIGTCFQCVLDLVGGRVTSGKGCITVVGRLPAYGYLL